MKPICFPCQRFFRPVKTGFYFTEGMPVVDGAKPGIEDADKWKPYKLWVGDTWICQGCGAKIIVGFGSSAIFEQHEPEFEQMRQNLGADNYQVNDC